MRSELESRGPERFEEAPNAKVNDSNAGVNAASFKGVTGVPSAALRAGSRPSAKIDTVVLH